ncbi:MAG: hypothetical protein ACYC35_03990 [Pirellulales bacterium]
MSPAAEAVLGRLDETRQRWWLFTFLTSAVLASCASFGTLLVFVCTDALVQLSQAALAVLFVAWLGLTVAMAVGLFRRFTQAQRNLAATARRVELELPEVGSDLINLVQLSHNDGEATAAFSQAAVAQAAGRLATVRFDQAARKESRWRRFRFCMQTPRDLGESFAVLLALGALAVLCHLLIPSWGSAASRLMNPWKFVPSIGSVRIVEVKPGNTEVLIGSRLDVVARIDNPEGRSYPATLYVTREGQEETALAMQPDDENRRYTVSFPSVLAAMQYRLEIGDSQTEVYKVQVREKPTISEVEVTFHYPAYLDRLEETFKQKTADLEAPQFTTAELKIRPSTPIAGGYVRMGQRRFTGRAADNGRQLVVSLPLVEDATYTVHMFNSAEHTDPNPRVNRIRVIPDGPPTVQLAKPAAQSNAAPGAKVPVVVRATDDYGLGRVRLEMKVKTAEQGAAETIQPVTSWTKFESSTTAILNYDLAVAAGVKPGQTVFVRAVASDRRDVNMPGADLRPQETAGAWHAIQIVDKEAESSKTLAELDDLRASLWRILEKQIRARLAAAQVAKAAALADGVRAAGEVRAQQVELQKAVLAVIDAIGKTDDQTRIDMKRALGKLANGDMIEAVRLAEAAAGAKAVAGLAEPAGKLTAAQDRIIEVLRRLLDATRRATAETLGEMKTRPGGDLPNDVQEKLRALEKKLEEFLKQQKKVIEATENLAKKPVEDFTEKEDQLLKDLAAAEDDWSKFMKEMNTDLSKLPEQDFANSSLLKELIEVQTELKMAEDALTKKTADIAVPLEQLGYEMAEEMTTNIEKWLPDTPDRERWSQEESLSDKDKEAPMAELPGELEDIVGDLMEQEEDLFNEMEDVSSSAVDSLDKGAGWDAADGPISNNSARGVTGNRLPNTSEIAGRSGEGRSGKSSGEFVGDEAVGKGGRKTPSRLTPDANVKGQIKDRSKDPTGGATGGGKESGQGGMGLEGPTPKSPGPRELQRLAGKQAALRNKAEKVDVQFQIMNFHHTDLKKMIDLMASVERDLASGRYQNAMRQRKVLLDEMGTFKQYLKGEFTVRQDQTVNLPTDVQKEILGSMQEASPTGWEDLNRSYFERLSSGEGKSKE